MATLDAISSPPSRPTNIVDLRATTNHPLSLPYSEIYSAGLLNGRLEHGRSQPGCEIRRCGPFAVAAHAAVAFGIDHDGVTEMVEVLLAGYYERVRPSSAAEWLGIAVGPGNPLGTAPPWAAVLPWRARSLTSYRQAYEQATAAENGVYGAALDISHGWYFCGPVSGEKCRVEAIRLLHVLREISRHGYKRSDTPQGDVKVTALIREDADWRWLITAGNHRAAAVSALGYAEIPIRVNLVINRQHAAFWPHVIDGLYSERNALTVFDNCFAAATPPIMRDWLSTLKGIQ